MSHKKVWIEVWEGRYSISKPNQDMPNEPWFAVHRTTRAGKTVHVESHRTLGEAMKTATQLSNEGYHFSLEWYEELKVLLLLRAPLTKDHFYAGKNKELRRVMSEVDYDSREF